MTPPQVPHAESVVLVKYHPSTDTDQQRRARQLVDVVHSRPLSLLAHRVERLTLQPGSSLAEAIQRLTADLGVLHAEPDYVAHVSATPDDPFYIGGSLWGMYGDGSTPANEFGSQAAEAWAAGYVGSADTYIAMVDKGVQITHPDLRANIWTNPYDPVDGIDNDGNGYVDDIHGWDFFHNDNTVYDGPIDDHGTHVAGTLAAEGGNGLGAVGVNWRVTLIPTKFAGPTHGYISGAIAALDYVTDLKRRHGLNVVVSNNSWGTSEYSPLLADAINRAADAGLLVVTSAGNGIEGIGQNNDYSPRYPANHLCVTRYDTGAPRGHDCLLSVASINPIGGRSTYSNYGVQSVDLGAPGFLIVSTWPEDGYALISGTSVATPLVSGAIALCASINPALTDAQLLAITLQAVTPTASLDSVTLTGGRLNIGAMVPRCEAPVGGRHLTLQAGDLTRLRWIGGVEQKSYSLLSFRNGVPQAPITLPAGSTEHADTTVDASAVTCHVLLAAAVATNLGVSDVLCSVRGHQSGASPPGDVELSLRDTRQAHIRWTPPPGGADGYLLFTIPLDGSAPTRTSLPNGFTATRVPLTADGACFQLVAQRGSSVSSSEVLCGIAGVSSFNTPTTAAGRSDAAVAHGLLERLAALPTLLGAPIGRTR